MYTSIYESTRSMIDIALGSNIVFFLTQAIILILCFYLGLIGSRKKTVSFAILIFVLISTIDLSRFLKMLENWCQYFRISDSYITKIELMIADDSTLTLISIAIISFVISYITTCILDIFATSILATLLYIIFKSSIEPVFLETWGEPLPLMFRIILHLIVFTTIYYICKASLIILYALFFSFIGSVGCFRAIETMLGWDCGFRDFFSKGDIFRINLPGQIASVLLFGTFVWYQLSFKNH